MFVLRGARGSAALALQSLDARGGNFRRRLALLIELATLVPILVVGLEPPAASAATSIGGDKTKIAQLETKIAQLGDQVQNFVTRYNTVQGHLQQVQHQLIADNAKLVVDERAQHAATLRLRTWAVDAYVGALSGDSSTLPSIFGSENASTLPEQQVYLGIANGSLSQAMTTLQLDENRTAVTEEALRAEQADIAATLPQLASARDASEAAIRGEQASLGAINGNLLALVNAANERRQAAEEQQAEQELAAAAAQQASATAAPSPTITPTTGTYANPLRGVRGLTSERIDQGVDYGGFGPVYAVGDGVVLSTVVGGWPGGTFISYRLTNGPAAGLVVYAAESLQPTVQIGQNVSANTVIGQMYESYSGIETGWTDSRGDGTTMAADNGEYGSTAFGYNFSQFMQSLGAPGGVLEGGPYGSLPSNWPHW